jgi:hypothetical protein
MRTNRVALAVIVLSAILAYVSISQAAGRFGPQTMKGVYAFSGAGTLGFGTIPAAVAGLNSFDGTSACGISARLNSGGTVSPLTSAECSYQVNPDGSGTLRVRFNEPPFGPFLSHFVIADSGKELHFMLSDEIGLGTVASGVSKRQQSGNPD